MKAQHQEKIENLQKGHGRYHEICQDDFLNDVLKSKNTLVHFYHADFENCKVIDHHLAILAPRHVECKMMKMDAAKSPFFVQKLQVRVMPTVVVFKDGVASARLVGFDGLTGRPEGGPRERVQDRSVGGLAREGRLHRVRGDGLRGGAGQVHARGRAARADDRLRGRDR